MHTEKIKVGGTLHLQTVNLGLRDTAPKSVRR